ncbi:hypothetical protein K435DRAFT_869828 [Dendrothele bispora CBS 962.96]|uniref:ABC transporter domain-containing protein n=1 Tax=Dendrothele bispora (strain CBS 962.96) TaxID=1314807 RepID=A0A4S8L8K5_DENBC|nr:hypothetical protein K435DRAFT_869828 [Dendrothele bispora CBS 962.96]
MGRRTRDIIPDWNVAFFKGNRIAAGDKTRVMQAELERSQKQDLVNSQRSVSQTTKTGNIVADFHNVKVQYQERKVLKIFNWQIRQGERWHLQGENGCDKSTLLTIQSYTQLASTSSHLHLFGKPRSRIPTLQLQSIIGVLSPGIWRVPSSIEYVCVTDTSTDEDIDFGVRRVEEVLEHLGPEAWTRERREIDPESLDSDVQKALQNKAFAAKPFVDLFMDLSMRLKWNDLVFKGHDALNRLLMTNNFPELTRHVCPAPWRGFQMGWMKPNPPSFRAGKRIAVIESGPVATVYDRNDRIRGLLMLRKSIVQRRVDLMAAEGIVSVSSTLGELPTYLFLDFVPNAHVGFDVGVEAIHAAAENDGVDIASSTTWPRDLRIPDADGIHFAMGYLQVDSIPNHHSISTWRTVPISMPWEDVIDIGAGDSMVRAARRHLRSGGVGDEQAVVVITHWEEEVPWTVEDGLKKRSKNEGRVF